MPENNDFQYSQEEQNVQSELRIEGQLTFSVTSTVGMIPVENATITISDQNAPENILATVTTDENGQTQNITLQAPPFAFSQAPGQERPYASYAVEISAPGYENVRIEGTEVLSDAISLQPVRMNPVEELNIAKDLIIIPPHTLYGDFPPKIPEAEIKPVPERGEIVLSRVVIPEYVVVHDGAPNDSSAPNYYVK